MEQAPNLEDIADPVQRLLVMQVQQNTMLMQKMLQPRESMASLLSSGSDDLFLKQIQESEKVANQVRMSALTELGMPEEKEDAFLMYRYVERRIPLADEKMLSHFAVLLGEGWVIAHQNHDVVMKGFLARALIFLEQCALDGGRMELAWLLSGFSEPSTHLHFPLRKTPGLKPFSRLVHPLWVSANLAYLRDLDYLEGRASTLGRQRPKDRPDAPESNQDPPKAKPKPKKPKKGVGKGEAEEPHA